VKRPSTPIATYVPSPSAQAIQSTGPRPSYNPRTCVYSRCADFLISILQWLWAGPPIVDKVNRTMDRFGREPASCGWVAIADGCRTSSIRPIGTKACVSAIRLLMTPMGQRLLPGILQIEITKKCGVKRMAGAIEWDVKIRRFADDVRQVCLAMLMVLTSNDSGQRSTHAANSSLSIEYRNSLVARLGIRPK
jgi:hypothetical protein